MGLHSGKKYGKIQIRKQYSADICLDCKIYIWSEEVLIGEDGQYITQDKFVGSETMKNVHEK